MEFIKVGKNYMIKNGNGRMITEKEKLELENKELIIPLGSCFPLQRKFFFFPDFLSLWVL